MAACSVSRRWVFGAGFFRGGGRPDRGDSDDIPERKGCGGTTASRSSTGHGRSLKAWVPYGWDMGAPGLSGPELYPEREAGVGGTPTPSAAWSRPCRTRSRRCPPCRRNWAAHQGQRGLPATLYVGLYRSDPVPCEMKSWIRWRIAASVKPSPDPEGNSNSGWFRSAGRAWMFAANRVPPRPQVSLLRLRRRKQRPSPSGGS